MHGLHLPTPRFLRRTLHRFGWSCCFSFPGRFGWRRRLLRRLRLFPGTPSNNFILFFPGLFGWLKVVIVVHFLDCLGLGFGGWVRERDRDRGRTREWERARGWERGRENATEEKWGWRWLDGKWGEVDGFRKRRGEWPFEERENFEEKTRERYEREWAKMRSEMGYEGELVWVVRKI